VKLYFDKSRCPSFKNIKEMLGFFEIVGECFNPGPIGGIKYENVAMKRRSNMIDVVRFCISVTLVLCFEYFLFSNLITENRNYFVLFGNIFFILYLVVSFYSNIKPNYDNIGWVPFFIDNPFRFSDDVNRFYIMLNVLLWPGRYISRSLMGIFAWL